MLGRKHSACSVPTFNTQRLQNNHTHTHTHARARAFNGPLSGTTQVSGYQKGKPIWILLKQETVSGSGISWDICKSAPCPRQTTTPAPHHSVFIGRMPFLPPNQQRQSTEGKVYKIIMYIILYSTHASGGCTGGPSRLRPPPLGDGPTLSRYSW